MSSTPTTSNRFAKQGTGDNAGTWGDVVNTQDLDLIDDALDGITTIAVSGFATLASSNYSTDQARKRILKCTGTGGAITIPGVPKWYFVHNACTGTLTIKTASGAGAAIRAGTVTPVYCDGVACVAASNLWPLSNGTAVAPSLSFASDPNTGIYSLAPDHFGVAAGGVNVVDVSLASVAVTGTLSATGAVSAGGGGASGPGFRFASAPTTGLFIPATNFIGVATSGGEAGRVGLLGSGHISWFLGPQTYTFSALTVGLSIAYQGAGTQDGIVLRPQVDNAISVVFENAAGSIVGTISQSSTATAYNTSSDYRLKDNIADLTGSGAFIDALRPREWLWHETGERGAGFVAHEAQQVSPSSVTGDKDAVGADGKPRYQAMMPGSPEIIANLVAEMKALRARMAALETA